MKVKQIKQIGIVLVSFLFIIFFSTNLMAEELDTIIGDHEFEVIEIVPPTHTENGRRVLRCIYCQEIYTEILFATECVWDAWVVEIEPTCTTPGLMRRTCNVDTPHSESEEIPPLGHQLEENETRPASCEEDGELTISCAWCDYSRTEPYGEAFGHHFVGVITTPPSCGVDGERTYTCEHCGEYYTVSIDMLSHSWSEWINERYPEEGIEGMRYKICILCDERIEEAIPALELVPREPEPEPEPDPEPKPEPELPPPPFIGIEEAVVIGGNVLLWVVLSVMLFSEFSLLLWRRRRKRKLLANWRIEEEGGYELI